MVVIVATSVVVVGAIAGIALWLSSGWSITMPSTVPPAQIQPVTVALSPATPTRVPTLVLLDEDFSDGQDQGWTHSGGGIVSIEDEAGNKVYNLQGRHDGSRGFDATTFYDGSADWTDYEVEFDIKLHELDSLSAFHFRFSDWNNRYELAIRTGSGSWGYGGRFQLYQIVNGQEVDDMNGGYNPWIGAPVEVGRWHHVKVRVEGDRIRLYFDGELKFDRTGAKLKKGKIGFSTAPWPGNPADWPAWSGGKLASYGHLHIDNLVVRAIK